MATIASVTATPFPSQPSPVPIGSEIAKGIIRKLDPNLDPATREEYLNEICTVVENSFFGKQYQFPKETISSAMLGKEAVVNPIIIYILAEYVIGDKKLGEFPKFFQAFSLSDKSRKALEMIRQNRRETRDTLFLTYIDQLNEVITKAFDNDHFCRVIPSGQSCTIEDLATFFIMTVTGRTPSLACDPFAVRIGSTIAEAIACKLDPNIDPAIRAKYPDEICTVVENCFLEKRPLFHKETVSIVVRGNEGVVTRLLFYLLVEYVIGDRKTREFPQFFQGFSLKGENGKALEMIRQNRREGTDALFLMHLYELNQLLQFTFNDEKFYQMISSGQPCNIEGLTTFFIKTVTGRAPSLASQPFFVRFGSRIAEAIVCKLDPVDLVIQKNLQEEICTVVEECFFAKPYHLAKQVMFDVMAGEERVVAPIIVYILAEYVIGDRQTSEFPEFFQAFSFKEEDKKELETIRQNFREIRGTHLLEQSRKYGKIVEMTFTDKKFYKTIAQAPIKGLVTSFIAMLNIPK